MGDFWAEKGGNSKIYLMKSCLFNKCEIIKVCLNIKEDSKQSSLT